MLPPSHKKPIHRTWLSQNSTKINSFCNQTIHTSFCIHLWRFPTGWLKNHDFTYSPIFLPRQKKQIHQSWVSQNPTRINSFCNQTFHTSFCIHLWNSPPRLLKNRDFTFSLILLPRHKKPIHPTWLSQNPTKINSYCNQPFENSLWVHLGQFPTKIAQKPWLHLFTHFANKAKRANPPNLAKTKPNEDQFLLQPNISHLILHTFVTLPHQDCSKTMTSLFHQFYYQDTKTRPSDQTWLSQNPTKIDSFCNQTFDTSFWMHLWQFPTKIAQKPWHHLFTNFATKAQ